MNKNAITTEYHPTLAQGSGCPIATTTPASAAAPMQLNEGGGPLAAKVNGTAKDNAKVAPKAGGRGNAKCNASKGNAAKGAANRQRQMPNAMPEASPKIK